MNFHAPVLITTVRDQFLTALLRTGNATSQFELSRKATLLCVGRFAREMRCTRGLQANQALQNLQLKGVQLSKMQMERLASSAMARFLYKGPGPCLTRSNPTDAQSLIAQSSILPKSYATRAQARGLGNSSPVSNGFGVGRGQGFRNFMRGYVIGRRSHGLVSVNGVYGEGNNGSDRESPDSSFFGKPILWMYLVSQSVAYFSYFGATASIVRATLRIPEEISCWIFLVRTPFTCLKPHAWRLICILHSSLARYLHALGFQDAYITMVVCSNTLGISNLCGDCNA